MLQKVTQNTSSYPATKTID